MKLSLWLVTLAVVLAPIAGRGEAGDALEIAVARCYEVAICLASGRAAAGTAN